MVQELKLNENATGAQQSEAAGATSTVQEIDAAVVEEHDLMDVTDVHNERSSVRGKPLPPSGRAAKARPIRSFMLVAPLGLALMFCYFHLQLVRLWEGCAKMPAVLPNGHTIDQAVHLWLTVGLIRSEEPLLRGRGQRFGALQRWLAMFLGYGVAPATLYFVWARSSVLHNRRLSVNCVMPTWTLQTSIWPRCGVLG